ncbi:MAG: hypothetical protein ABI876_16415 [Bacteroidota bacterium]
MSDLPGSVEGFDVLGAEFLEEILGQDTLFLAIRVNGDEVIAGVESAVIFGKAGFGDAEVFCSAYLFLSGVSADGETSDGTESRSGGCGERENGENDWPDKWNDKSCGSGETADCCACQSPGGDAGFPGRAVKLGETGDRDDFRIAIDRAAMMEKNENFLDTRGVQAVNDGFGLFVRRCEANGDGNHKKI